MKVGSVLCIAAILVAFLSYKIGIVTAERDLNETTEQKTNIEKSFRENPSTISNLTPGTCDQGIDPIEVESSGGTTFATYATLGAAFSAINSGTHTGVITIDVCGNTTEPATATLNASGQGGASYTSITISPAGGAARTISGDIAGNALIQLNGADNVTIDGLNTGGNSLTISNTSTSSTSGTSTIRLVNDATNNLITNCSILGSSTMATITNGGTIFISTAASGGNGNDNNTFSNNKIGPAGTNLPTKAIYGNGSISTTASYNNNITFSNNEIFDYFNASAASHGVYLSAGNDNWTFSNNKFYQTTARTQTSGVVHAAIQVAAIPGNTSHTFTGNIIGYSSPSGTGTYQVTLGNAGRFFGILISGSSVGGTHIIQNNTITNISIDGLGSGTNTSSPFTAILVSSGSATTITGNTIGSVAVSGAINFSSSSTTSSHIHGIYLSSVNGTISNNTIAGITATNTSNGTVLVYGIRASTILSMINTIQNNTIGTTNAPIQNNASQAGSRVWGIYSQTGASVITGNVVQNLTMSAGTTGGGVTASVIGIVSDNQTATNNNNISQNTIHSLSNTNPTAAVQVTGIVYRGNISSNVGNVVARNFIHSLSVSSSGAASLRGIQHLGGNATYQNNMIRLGIDASGNSVTGAYNIAGYEETSGSNNFYHNTIYIGGSAGTSNTFSNAFLSSVTSSTRNFINNVLINDRSISGGTGANLAATYSGTLPNPLGLNSNYNFYYSQNNATIIRNGTTNYSLVAWRAASGNQDGNSFQALNVAQFNLVNPTGNAGSVDLHIANIGLSILEQSGTPIGSVTDDFDGQLRANFTPVDVGADAGNFTQLDAIPPIITYTPFARTSSTSNRNLSVNITDSTGVASGLFAPRIYYRKGTSGPYVSTQCTGTQPNYTCTIDYSQVGGVVVGDVIQYFVVAQDTLGNLGANPSGSFAGTDVNNITTPPTNPNQYLIAQAFSGSYNVGTGETYTSLTNTGGIFEAINNGVLTGNVTINITSDLTGETGTVALNETVSEGGGPFSITIKPSGMPRTVSSTTTAVRLIMLNGADNITIDGSLSGGTDRSLTLSLTNSSNSGTVVVWVGSLGAGAGATNVTIKNCIIQNGTNFNNTTINLNFGIFAGASSGSSYGFDNDNLVIQNNLIQRTSIAIQAAGDPSGLADNMLIADNIIGGAATADYIGLNGIVIAQANGATITRNIVRNIANSADTNLFGIAASERTFNSSITHNSVSNMEASAPSGYGSNGITISTGTAMSNITVANNFIYDLRGTSSDTGNLARTNAGIRIAVSNTGGINVWNNSVNLFGNYAGFNTATVTAALMVNAFNPSNLDIRNNIFANSFNNTSNTGAGNYAIYTTSPNTIFSNINYNDYFVSGTQGLALGVVNNITVANLSALQAATGQDANSISANPLFLSDNDLHLQVPASPVLNAGISISGITNDFDTDPRPSGAGVEIGADEVVQSSGGLIAGGNYYNVLASTGDSLGGNVTVRGYLTVNGLPNLNGQTLTLGCQATVYGVDSNNYLVGNNDGRIARQICSTGSYTFPIGLNGYSPVDVNVTTLTTNPSTLSVLVINGHMPGLNPAISLNRRWYLDLTGNMTADLTFNYVDADVNGNESDYRIYRITLPNPTPMLMCSTPCVNTATNQLTITNINQFSLWSGGQSQIVTAASVTLMGRVMTADGRGIRNALVTMIESNGNVRTVVTGPFGYYRFTDVEAGQTVILMVTSKRFTFDQPTQVVTVTEEMKEVNFVARE
ncbi:MAG: hypothetical protein KatS3mg006_0892 [Pyrinomonadaceae bacterium]|jgi:putative cofactor-binding repeat protein|nr:MAG: hypothetical protein KatS3mg006_0892 [Pyrinomonadaceae bacterium]